MCIKNVAILKLTVGVCATEKLETRRKKRQLKARDEKRREKRIAEEENKKFLGKYPTPNIQIESHQHFPEFTPEAASSYKRTDSESTPPRSLSPVSSSSRVGSLNDSGMSFAKVKFYFFCCVFCANCG